MRIVSGEFKGKRLSAPKNLPVRPTTDMAKEALFNILNNRFYLDELTVLDLFSGTGNISYEFASRGCHDITAIDAHFGCVKYISQTASEMEMPISVQKIDVYSYLEKTPQQFDLIFADPPYDLPIESFLKIAELVFERNLLKAGGCLIIEHEKHMKLDQESHFTEKRKYGSSVFSFFSDSESQEL